VPGLSPLQLVGFLLALAAVIGNDSLQTLGTFLSSNRDRTPPALQMGFLAALTAAVLSLGWWLHAGDPAWGRLVDFPLPESFSWVDLLPPLAALLLTCWGAPLSTSVLLLTAIAPANLEPLLVKSLAGYGLAFSLALLLYGLLLWPLERALQGAEPADGPPWLVLQWLSTAWLWSQWLVHDLANIFVLLPRQLGAGPMALTTALLCAGLCGLVAWGGGPIQQVVQNKTNAGQLRSATLIDLLFGALLLALARWSPMPLSTTWVFLGLLAGRELALLPRLHTRLAGEVAVGLGRDLAKASLALLLSLAVALLVQPLKGLAGHP
jgi:hypothetical protein